VTYFGHAVVLGLAWFGIVNAVLSIAVTVAAPLVSKRLPIEPPRTRARALLAMRLLPAASAFAFVLCAFAPSYLALEPRTAVESLDTTLAVLAAIALVLMACSMLRGLRAWWRTTRAANALLAVSTPLSVDRHLRRAFVVPSAQPEILLLGVARPKLIVTRGLLDLLSPDELTATVRHETGHSRAFDNLKRLAMRLVPDFWWWTGAAQAVEQAWAGAAEAAADSIAAAPGRADALALASAIVKVARTAPAKVPLPCASTLVDRSDVEWRVRRLLDGRESAPDHAARFVWLGPAAAVALLYLAYGPVIVTVHRLSELLVHLP
jgi:Zn-dependent protease with chaperone function